MSDAVLLSSLSSLERIRSEFGLIAHNVANADNPSYAKLRLNVAPNVTGGNLLGVEIESISTYLDDALQDRLYNKISEDVYAKEIAHFQQDICELFGGPGSTMGLNDKLSKVFSALDVLSYDTSSISAKQIAVGEFSQLAESISSIAAELQNMRLAVDNELFNSVQVTNDLLANAFINASTAKITPPESLENVLATDKLRQIMEELAEYLPLYKYTDDKGNTKVFTYKGDALVGEMQYQLKYSPQTSVDSIIAGAPFSSVLLSGLNSLGTDIQINLPLIPGGVSIPNANTLSTGKFGALIELRDTIIPNILQELDNLAYNMKTQFNIAHNSGTGFPPPVELTGNTWINYDAIPGFTGTTRIAIVDNNGNAIPNIPALNLNLGTLDTGNGAGRANVEGILQEVRYHFGEKLTTKSVALGNLSDIRLASLTSSVAASTPFNLDLELDNFSQGQSTVQIQAATAQDAFGNNILNSVNTTSFAIPAGKAMRTGASGPSLSLQPMSLNYPFTVNLTISVNDGATTSTSTLSYLITPTNNSINGALNQRFAVASKVNPSDPGIINNPPLGIGVVEATLTDTDDIVVPAQAGAYGRMELDLSGSGYRIAVDGLDSMQIGDHATGMVATGKDFVSFFGLNDLLVRTDAPQHWGNIANSAIYLDVRSDIKQNPNYFANSSLDLTVDPSNPLINTHQYHISAANDSTIKRMQNLATQNTYFGGAGGLPPYNTTLSRYVAFIVGSVANNYNTSVFNAEQADGIRAAIAEKIQSFRGVNINMEMSNMVTFQQAFAASARVMQTTDELFKALLEIFR